MYIFFLEYPRSSTETETLKAITGKFFFIEKTLIFDEINAILDDTSSHLTPNGNDKHHHHQVS